MTGEKLYVVMPAYNEEANIQDVVLKWHNIVESINEDSRLLVVNDGSKDKTESILQNLKEKCPQLIYFTKPNSGHGSTCMFGYKMALKDNADFVFQTDSDGQTDEMEFWKFWRLREKHDFVIGDRKGRKDGLDRLFVSYVLRIFLWFIFGAWISDPNTPFRLMRGERLTGVLTIIPEDFFLINVAISAIVTVNREKSAWVPISFKPRQGGKNSINFTRIIKIGIRSYKDFKLVKLNIQKQHNAQDSK